MQAQATSAAEEDDFYERAVFRHVLCEYPTIFRLSDLVREVAKDPDEFGDRDGVERAAGRQVKAGVLYRRAVPPRRVHAANAHRPLHLGTGAGMKDRETIGMQFGTNLSQAREWAKLTQTDLARQASMRQCDISRFERGVVCPRLDTAARLAESLGVQLRDLLFEIE
ncbi:MAG: helix-turn-helix domain-containing protein [Solirubrobacterales bacterium]